MIYFLLGMPGSGKTTLGRKIADKFKLPFWDVDEQIVIDQQMSIPEIFEKYDEAYFRNLESEKIEEISKNGSGIISTGGGAPCYNNNMERMNRLGTTIFLDVPIQSILPRIIQEGVEKRPLLASKANLEQFLTKMYTVRIPYYSLSKLRLSESDISNNELESVIEN